MDWGKSFTYVFDDKEWVTKVLIGGILGLIPIVNLAVVGYALRVLKNVAEGAEQPLPGWDDFGDYFVKGLMSTLGALIWAIPLIALAMFAAFVSAVTGYDTAEPGRVAAPIVLCIWSMSCLSALYGLFLGLVLPSAYTHYALSGDFGAFFRFGDIFQYIQANLGNYIIAVLLAIVAQFVAGFGTILCCIGVIFTEFWATLVGSHLLGQVYRSRAMPSVPTTETEAIV
ncbi:MAG: DUF4013 domain-containing protein [Chloroflexi bacterium]|nr:DUF4013 domain-containing protein [Chloroflexota bacterium]